MNMNVSVTAPIVQVSANGICRIEQQEYPAVGFGTAHMKRTPELCSNTVKAAAELGYRIIDTATRYMNFVPISQALEGFERRDFYIISKVWHNAQSAKKLHEDLLMTLDQLKVTYIDAYLLHWPNSKVPIEETLYAMEELRNKKLIRHIGLSNITVHHLKRALQVGVPIAWVQVEMSPFFYDPELLAFCRQNSIAVQASAPLHESGISEDPFLSELGKKYGKTPAQIALRWILQHECLSLPRSGNRVHMQQNKDILDFTLSEQEMKDINARAKVGTRKIRVIGEAVKIEGFTDEFDFSYEQCWPNPSRL